LQGDFNNEKKRKDKIELTSIVLLFRYQASPLVEAYAVLKNKKGQFKLIKKKTKN